MTGHTPWGEIKHKTPPSDKLVLTYKRLVLFERWYIALSYVHTKRKLRFGAGRVEPETFPFNPDWKIEAAPMRRDEPEAKAAYEAQMRETSRGKDSPRSWEELDEWQRESWRREIRG